MADRDLFKKEHPELFDGYVRLYLAVIADFREYKRMAEFEARRQFEEDFAARKQFEAGQRPNFSAGKSYDPSYD